MNTINRDIGARLEQIRESLHLTQEAMGEKLGKGKGSVCKYEKGDTEPTMSTLMEYAKLGQVTLDWIFTGNKDQEKHIESHQQSNVCERHADYSPEINKLVDIINEYPMMKLLIPEIAANCTDQEQFELWKKHHDAGRKKGGANAAHED